MPELTPRMLGGFSLAGFFIGWMTMSLSLLSAVNTWAGSPANASVKHQGNVEAGRSVFNGKGICYYCHGVDGRPDQRPQLDQETASVVARLSPIPVDLRNPKMLKLKSDKERSRAIREGHPGTGMLPDTTLTDQEIRDTLAYLTLLRREGYSNKR